MELVRSLRSIIAIPTVIAIGALSIVGCVVEDRQTENIRGFYGSCESDFDCPDQSACYTVQVSDRFGTSSESICTWRCNFDGDCPQGGVCQGADTGPALCIP